MLNNLWFAKNWLSYPQLIHSLDIMDKPPFELDAARVLCWTICPTGYFYEIKSSNPNFPLEEPIFITAMAICEYDGGHIYLLKCNSQWDVEQDSVCNSIEEAKSKAQQMTSQKLVWEDS